MVGCALPRIGSVHDGVGRRGFFAVGRRGLRCAWDDRVAAAGGIAFVRRLRERLLVVHVVLVRSGEVVLAGRGDSADALSRVSFVCVW